MDIDPVVHLSGQKRPQCVRVSKKLILLKLKYHEVRFELWNKATDNLHTSTVLEAPSQNLFVRFSGDQ